MAFNGNGADATRTSGAMGAPQSSTLRWLRRAAGQGPFDPYSITSSRKSVLKTGGNCLGWIVRFILYLCCTVTLIMGTLLACWAAYVTVTRIPSSLLVNQDLFLCAAGSLAIAGVMCSAASWMAWGIQDHRYNNATLPLLILTLCGSLVMLGSGIALCQSFRSSIGFNWQFANIEEYIPANWERVSFPVRQNPGVVQRSLDPGTRRRLNSTMSEAILLYDYSYRYRLSWDRVQRQFRCCGATDPSQWVSMRQTSPPKSCCDDNKPTTCAMVFAYPGGCIDAVVFDLVDKSTSLCLLGSILAACELLTLVVSSVIYVGARAKRDKRSRFVEAYKQYVNDSYDTVQEPPRGILCPYSTTAVHLPLPTCPVPPIHSAVTTERTAV